MPAWRLVDPLVVLSYLDEESKPSASGDPDEDDDSLESLFEDREETQEGLDKDAQPEGITEKP